MPDQAMTTLRKQGGDGSCNRPFGARKRRYCRCWWTQGLNQRYRQLKVAYLQSQDVGKFNSWKLILRT